MLDKISNISAGSEYGKSVSTNSFNNLLGAAYSKKVDAHDSVDISPALQYLNRANWRLKEFKHIVNEKIYLDFIASDIEFQTTIDLSNLSTLSFLDYRVIKERKGNNWRSKTFLDITSVLTDIQYYEEPVLVNFSALNVFLQRIFDRNIFREITGDDKYMIDDLLREIKTGINNEFIYLNSFLFTFVDKLTGIRVNKKSKNNPNAEPLVIKKIKVLNAE